MIIALFLVTSVGLTAGALATLGTTALSSTSSLQHLRNVEFAGDAAVEAAIQELRYQAPPSPLTCPNFPAATNSTFTVNSVSVVVECSIGRPPGFYGRIVQFDACPATSGSPSPSWSTCQSNSVVQATVVYNDVNPTCSSGANPGCYGGSPGYWGQGGVSVENWYVRTANG